MDILQELESAFEKAKDSGDGVAHKLLDLLHEHTQARLALHLVEKKISQAIGVPRGTNVDEPKEVQPLIEEDTVKLPEGVQS